MSPVLAGTRPDEPEVRWPNGAVPQAQILQKHDEELLHHELEQGATGPRPMARVDRNFGGGEMIEGDDDVVN